MPGRDGNLEVIRAVELREAEDFVGLAILDRAVRISFSGVMAVPTDRRQTLVAVQVTQRACEGTRAVSWVKVASMYPE